MTRSFLRHGRGSRASPDKRAVEDNLRFSISTSRDLCRCSFQGFAYGPLVWAPNLDPLDTIYQIGARNEGPQDNFMSWRSNLDLILIPSRGAPNLSKLHLNISRSTMAQSSGWIPKTESPTILDSTPTAPRTHISRLLGPKTILYRAFGRF